MAGLIPFPADRSCPLLQSFHLFAESKIIATASVCDTDEVAYKKVEGSDCAYVTASYFLRSTKAYNRANQEYVLRKDENGDWKILGFVALEGDNGDAEK